MLHQAPMVKDFLIPAHVSQLLYFGLVGVIMASWGGGGGGNDISVYVAMVVATKAMPPLMQWAATSQQ